MQSDGGSIKSYDNLNKSKLELSEKKDLKSEFSYATSGGELNVKPLCLTSSSSNSMPYESERGGSIASYNSERFRDSKVRQTITSNELSVHSSSSAASNPGAEVLALIATWIKTAPNDFLGIFFFFFNDTLWGF